MFNCTLRYSPYIRPCSKVLGLGTKLADGRVASRSRYSHVGDPTHRVDHTDVRSGQTLCHRVAQIGQETRTRTDEGCVSVFIPFNAHHFNVHFFLSATGRH